MKILSFFCCMLISWQFCNAQVKAPDNEKLLEYYQMQRYSEALQYLQSIYDEHTEDPKELSRLAYTSLMAGNLPEAEKIYLKLYAQQPASLPVLFSLANISIRRSNYEKAKDYYTQALTIDSANFNTYKQLASLTTGDFNINRVKYLQKANVLNPIDADVAFNLAELYFKMNFFDKANKTLEPALQADTANLQLLKMKMPISISSKNYSEAIKTGQQLLSYGDSSTFVLNNLGKSYYLMLDYKNALKYFLIIKEKSDDNEALFYHIGLSYRGIKDYKNAIPYLQKAIKEGVSPRMATYYGLLGDSFENADQNEHANTAYKKGLQFENNGSLLYNIALVYETKLNDKKNAVNYYNQYLQTVDPKEQPKLVVFIKNKIEELKR